LPRPLKSELSTGVHYHYNLPVENLLKLVLPKTITEVINPLAKKPVK
jgi:hypothetical protein